MGDPQTTSSDRPESWTDAEDVPQVAFDSVAYKLVAMDRTLTALALTDADRAALLAALRPYSAKAADYLDAR